MYVLAAVLVVSVALIGVGGVVGARLLGEGETRPRGRFFTFAALAAFGVVAGLLGSVAQASVVHLGGSSGSGSGSGVGPGATEALGGQASALAIGGGSGIAIPVGVVLALAVLALALLSGVMLLRSPIGALIPGAGWLVVVTTFMYGSDKGDVVLQNTGPAQVFLYGGFLLSAAFALGAQQVQLREQLRSR